MVKLTLPTLKIKYTKNTESDSRNTTRKDLRKVIKKSTNGLTKKSLNNVTKKAVGKPLNKKLAKAKAWDLYFMSIAEVVKTKSDCLSRSVGAVLVNNRNRIIATGYNGAPKGIKNCNEGGCERCTAKIKGTIKSGEQLDKCICVHAEENAITEAAFAGTATADTTVYCTNLPCMACAKILIQADTKKIVYKDTYNSELTVNLLKQAKVQLVKLD
jgi:dCMP deaminase